MGDVVVSWFYEQNGTRNGPFTPTEIAALVRADVVNEHTMMWAELLSEWTPLFRTELRSLVGDKVIQPPPLPAPAATSAAPPPPPVWAPPGPQVVKPPSPQSSVPHYSSAAPPPPVWDARPAIPGQVTYGGFWIRVVAYLIDSMVLGVGISVVTFVLLLGIIWSGGDQDAGIGLAYLIGTVLVWLYFALMESSERGATLGKMALGLRVVSDQGQRISFMNATGRFFAKMVSGFILNIGFIMVGFTDRKRGLHDMMASTLVIKVH